MVGMNKETGVNLKKYREAFDLSQAELSRISGVSTAAISLIEKENRDMQVSTALKLASALQLSVEELCGENKPQYYAGGYIESRGALLKLKQKLSKIIEIAKYE